MTVAGSGHGRLFGVLGGVVDDRLDPPVDVGVRGLVHHTHLFEIVLEDHQGILAPPGLDVGGRPVLLLTIFGGVRRQPLDLALDQGRTFAGPRAPHGFPRDRVAGEHIGPVDDDTRKPVAGRAHRHILHGKLQTRRHGDRIAVVLDAEQHGQFVDAGEVQRLMPVALACAALAHRRHAHLAGAANLGRVGDAGGVQVLRADRTAGGEDLVRGCAQCAGIWRPPLLGSVSAGEEPEHEVAGTHALGQTRGERPVERHQPVALAVGRPT